MRAVIFLFACASFVGAAEYKVVRAVEYAKTGATAQLLDAHIPDGAGPFPAVILVHGGGWTNGDRTANFIQPLFPVLNETGFAWFTIDYRLAPANAYPAAADDVESAVSFVRQHAKEYKVNRARIALMGESAGGHLVNLVGARNAAGVAAVVSFYGPIDMVVWAERFRDMPLPVAVTSFFGIKELDDAGLEKIRQTSPAIYLNSKTPPFLFIHGTKDEAVDYTQSTLGMKLLKNNGTPCELITVTDGIHGVINWEKEQRFQSYKKPLIEWLHRTLGN